MLVVLDTNIIVSSLLSRSGPTFEILNLMLNYRITPCFDSRILVEYEEVLSRSKFGFKKSEINDLLIYIKEIGISVVPSSCSLHFTDYEDKKFYEVSSFCNAILITGNKKHFPDEPYIVSAREFLNKIKTL